MDNNLGDLLYIVFLIVIGIFSMLTSGKKKKRPGQVLGQPDFEERLPEDEEKPVKNFGDMLREMMQTDPDPAPQPVSQPKPASPLKRKKEKPAAATRKDPFTVKSPVEKKDEPRRSTLEESLLKDRVEDDHYMFEDQSFQNLEELRKAIIYTEILKRKY